MNTKIQNKMMIVLLIVTAIFLAGCGTLQIEALEPTASAIERQVTVEKPELEESATTSVLEETAVSPTPPDVNTKPAPTIIPPTAVIEAVPETNAIHDSGSNKIIVLPGCFDFDNGVSLAPPDPNCDFNLLPGPDSRTIEMYPVDPAQLAYSSVFPNPPTYAQCADNDAFSTEQELVAPMAAMYVCYQTGEGRFGHLHFTEVNLEQAYTVTLEWLTFSNEQNGGSVPEEMNLVFQDDIFGFSFALPDTWQGYAVTQNDYETVTNFCFTFIGSNPTCILQIDVYSQENWKTLEKVPDGYYLGENDLFVFAAGPFEEECIQLDDFQCARYQEIPIILDGFIVAQ